MLKILIDLRILYAKDCVQDFYAQIDLFFFIKTGETKTAQQEC